MSETLTKDEIEDVVVAIAKREGKCVCFTLTNVPVISLGGRRWKLKPHPRCPMHSGLAKDENFSVSASAVYRAMQEVL
jgi:hypothetical protein